jgi:hypothetical protein
MLTGNGGLGARRSSGKIASSSSKTPAEQQGRRSKWKSRGAKASREKGEEPAKDKTHKRKAKKRKLTSSVPDCEDEVAVDSGSEGEEDGPEQGMPLKPNLVESGYVSPLCSLREDQRIGDVSTYDHPSSELLWTI